MNYIYAMILVNLLVWIPWLWRYRIRPRFERKNIWSRLDNHPDKESYKMTHGLLSALYGDVNPARISQCERKRLNMQEDAFIYGEIDFLSFLIILDKVKPQSGEIFYDLGCGAGKAVFTAVLNFDFSQAVGVELLPGLCKLANAQIQKAESIVESQPKKFSATYPRKLSRIKILNEDLHHCDLSQANVVFINATCFSYSMWEKIQEKLLSLKPGSRVIVTSKKIESTCFQLISASLELMGWGMNSVNIYKKIL